MSSEIVESDSTYFKRRAAQEAAAAEKAHRLEARNAHLEMARRYDDMAAAIEKHDERLGLAAAEIAHGRGLETSDTRNSAVRFKGAAAEE